MVLLGTSDALRGIFSPLFLSGFGFSEAELGVIVSASYLGNLVFLLFGGQILDRVGLKKSMMVFVLVMALSLLLMLFGYIYAILVISFFLTLGLSTLLNTSINIASDSFSASGSLVYLNILFFIQGIGTSLSQLILSAYSENRSAWDLTLIVLSCLMVPVLIMLSKAKVEEVKKSQNSPNESKTGDMRSLILLILTLSFYTIAEHGFTNYIISYGISMGKESADMGKTLSLFSLGIMSGRLILGSLIVKFGERKMVLSSLAAGSILFLLFFFFGMEGLSFFLGFSISTLYPTLVAFSRRYVPSRLASRATATVVSLCSVMDIAFNFCFGFISSLHGFSESMKMLPIFMILAFLTAIPLLRKTGQPC